MKEIAVIEAYTLQCVQIVELGKYGEELDSVAWLPADVRLVELIKDGM